jgi:hypothetical protein
MTTKQSDLDAGTDVKVLSPQTSKYETFKIASKKTETPAERKAQLKKELNSLLNAMFNKDIKAITKPTYKKFENLLYQKGIHEATLKQKVSELKYIQQEWKSQNAQQRKTATISKRYTIKEMKNLHKTVQHEENTDYIVYINYKQIVEVTTPDKNTQKYQQMKNFKQPKQGSQTINVKEIINHHTEHVKGKHNIQDSVRKFITYMMSFPYVVDVKLLAVHANKSILHDNQYRWLGSKKDAAHNMKMFKAWNSQMCFKYHGYDLDMNDDTEFECVPSALFKMYGNKAERSRIPFIVNGGMDAVKSVLNDINMKGTSSSVVGFLEDAHGQKMTQFKENFMGYTPDDILMFCNRFKIRCFGFDFKFNMFITNRFDKIKFNDDLKAFVFYMNDEHIYLINNQEIRNSILHSSDKSDIISLMAKQRDIKQSKREMAVDLSVKQMNKVEKTNIYITESGRVNQLFYDFLCQGDVYNNKLKMNDGEGVVRFEYKKNNMIIFNPDYHEVMTTLTKLDPELYQFKNQRLNTLAKEVLDKQFGGYPLSTMNKAGDDIFHSDLIRNCQFNGWMSEPKTTVQEVVLPDGCMEMKCIKPQLSAYDYNKHYTSKLIGMDMQFGWPVYNIFDEVQKFDGKMTAGFYYVECSVVFPFRGNGWYEADLVVYGMETALITAEKILYQYKPSVVLPVDYFKKFVEFVYANFENPKNAINKLLGCFGHDFTNKNVHHFTTDGRLAFMELNENKDVKVKYVYHHQFRSEGETNIEELDIDKCISHEKPLCYHLYNTKEIKQFQNALPFFYKIYNCSAVQMHRMATQIGGIVRGIFTDTIIFENAVNIPKCDASLIGGIRESSLKEFTRLGDYTPRKMKYSHQPKTLNTITEFKLADNKGMYLTGLAGTGKTYTTNELKAQLQPEQYVVCTPTHKSALLVNGETIFNVFNVNPHDFTYLKTTVEKLKHNGVEWIFVDEISMIPSRIWAVLRDIKKIYGFKFVLVGDFGQLPAVEEKVYDVEASQIFYELCDGQKMELTKNFRAMNDPEFALFIDDLIKVREGQSINFAAYGSKECRRSIAWTNRTRKTINAEWMLKEAKIRPHVLINKFKVFVGLPVIANETHTFKNPDKEKFDVKNNEEFEVVAVDNQHVRVRNSRMEFSMEHKDFKYFDLAYCITVHKSQGSTFDFEYTIYEYTRFDKKLLYTAMSRATQKSNIHFIDFNAGLLSLGWIYKITDPNNKIYIGKTSTSVAQRWAEHQVCLDGSPLHAAIQRDGIEGWKCETVCSVEYAFDEELSVVETVQMMRYDSIVRGFNTKYSVPLEQIEGMPIVKAPKPTKKELKELMKDEVYARYMEITTALALGNNIDAAFLEKQIKQYNVHMMEKYHIDLRQEYCIAK